LEYNITDRQTGLLKKKLAQMELHYSNHPTITPLLKMMQSIGRYLDSKKDKAHPDSIPVLLSMADQLENIIHTPVSGPDKNRDDIDKIVSGEVQKYRALQIKINSKPVVNDADLNNLKTVILTIDWEISDRSLQHFEKVVSYFLSMYQQNKIYQNFLKIIQSLGQYIGSKKINAHPDAISFLRSVFDDFEKVVQTPGISYQNQKEILEKTISRFNELKTRITKEKKKTSIVSSITEDDSLPPALSHIKPASGILAGDVMPVATLSTLDEFEFKKNIADDIDIKPALSDRKRSPSAPRDVMGDLFSLKESPADELLDAIHLMDVHGPDQGRSSVLDRNAHSPSSGIKQFTPELKNITPIPEIEDRLDQFFNLETSPEPSIRQPLPADQTVELTIGPEEDRAEGIIPFQYEDESFEQGDVDHNDEKIKKEHAPEILDRLKTRMKTLDTLMPEDSLSSLKDDISKLKTCWLNDPEKASLLDLLSLTIGILEKSKHLGLTGGAVIHPGEEPIPQLYREATPGLFARIKALFTS
jgi:hypothetical protein